MNNYRSKPHEMGVSVSVVFIPKYRRKTLYGGLRTWGTSGVWPSSRVEEGHLLADHDMLVSIPPKYSVAQVIGYIKGKSAIPSLGSLRIRGATLLGTGLLRLDGRAG